MRNSRKQIHQRTRMRDSSYRNPPARLRNLEPRNLNKMPQAKRTQKRIGLAIIGAGRVGLFRGEVAARHGSVDWIGIAEILPERAKDVAAKVGADFVTNDYRELLRRPEVNAVIIATDEHLHVGPVMEAIERGLPMLIEKPLATRLAESTDVLAAIEKAGIDAVVGYTQRFRDRKTHV